MNRLRWLRGLPFLLPMMAVAVFGAARASEPLRAEPQSLESASPALLERLRANPYDYFRFVNRPWIKRVCEVFAQDLEALPIVRLHGDAHVEQFAITKDAWGLDDFDDSARGPAVVDIARFLGSIDLTTRRRSWQKDREKLFDRFVDGYKRGLIQPDYLPVPPDIVRRLRNQVPPTREQFFARAEKRMEPLPEPLMKAAVAGIEAFARAVLQERPDLPPDYFRIIRVGPMQGGVGSAVNPKIMARIRGLSDDPADDEILEFKKIGDLGGLTCLKTPTDQPSVRIIDGTKQLGRLPHSILVAGPDVIVPEIAARGGRLQDWWMRNLDPSYYQISLTDLQSVGDLAAISYDAGVQLGSGRLQNQTVLLSKYERERMLSLTGRLEKRYRQEATKLVDDLLRGWRELAKR